MGIRARTRRRARREGLPLKNCVIVGDRPDIDIIPVQMEGIFAFLIDREYKEIATPRIGHLSDLVKLFT